MSLQKELTSLLRKFNVDRNTPDHILAKFLLKCTDLFQEIVNLRDDWLYSVDEDDDDLNCPSEDSVPCIKANEPNPNNIVFTNAEGKTAVIDFSGDTVTYSGDLKVATSAKIFFDYIKSFSSFNTLTPGDTQ